jgi:hypothetical protein
LLTPIKAAMKILERDGYTIAHVPLVVTNLLNALSVAPSNNDLVCKVRLREALRQEVRERAGHLINDGEQPAMLAAVLDPRYGRQLRDIGIDREVYMTACTSIKVWIAYIIESKAPAREQAVRSQERHDWSDNDNNDDDDYNNNNNNKKNNAGIAAEVEFVTKAFDDYQHASCTPTHMALYPLPRDAATMAVEFTSERTAVVLREVFGGSSPHRVLAPVVRMIMSMPASSASAERAFSTSGRICSPFRNRLAPSAVEQLTVLHHFISMLKRHNTNAVRDFCSKFFNHLQAMNE